MDLEETTYGHRAIIVANAPLNSENNVKDGSQLGYMVGKDVTRRWAGIHASVQVRTFSSKAKALGTGPRAKGPKAYGLRAPFLEGNWKERATIPTEFIAFQSKCVKWKGPIKENVYKFLLDPRMFEIAYAKLRNNPGNLTPGINPTPLDGINAEWIQETIASLKDESFQFTPSRRINTAKPQGGTKAALGGPRPFTIAPPRDKIVMEVMRMILEAIYEPTFSPHSHGFRAAHSCHTAFRQIREKFGVASWYMVGDITKCYDTIDHHKLMALIESKILDRKFSRLVWKSLRAGYFEFDNSQQSLIGTPQGSVISPILANIFMDQLDKFIESSFMNLFMKGLMKGFDQGTHTCNFIPCHRLNGRLNHSIENLPKEETRKIPIQMRILPARDPMDPNFRRLVYVRYVDNWIIGIRGSHAEIVHIKTKVEEFLKEKMGLTLNAEKTLITHAETEKALFLDTYIFKAQARITRTSSKDCVMNNAKEIRLEAPIKHIVSKLTKAHFVRERRSWPKFIWIHYSLDQIITLYNAVIRRYMNYYSFVDNRGALATYVYYLLRGSCAKLIAAKMKLASQLKVFEKYGKFLTVNAEKNLFLHKPGYKRRRGCSKSAM
jgi:group II intron reverse transcriptase/maturase